MHRYALWKEVHALLSSLAGLACLCLLGRKPWEQAFRLFITWRVVQVSASCASPMGSTERFSCFFKVFTTWRANSNP